MIEQDLVEQIQKGDPEAFRIFYERYSSLVYRYVRFRVNSDADAEDLTAEVFIRAWRGFPAYEWRGKPLHAWLFRIAYNLIVDRSRKKRLNFTSLSNWFSSNGHQEYERIENADVISKAFETLSYDEQMILYLSYYESYSNKEIAEIMGKTENALGVAKFRALKRLNKVLKRADA